MVFFITLGLIALIVICFAISNSISNYVQDLRSRATSERFYDNVLAAADSDQEAGDQISKLKEASLELGRKRAVRKQIEEELNIEM